MEVKETIRNESTPVRPGKDPRKTGRALTEWKARIADALKDHKNTCASSDIESSQKHPQRDFPEADLQAGQDIATTSPGDAKLAEGIELFGALFTSLKFSCETQSQKQVPDSSCAPELVGQEPITEHGFAPRFGLNVDSSEGNVIDLGAFRRRTESTDKMVQAQPNAARPPETMDEKSAGQNSGDIFTTRSDGAEYVEEPAEADTLKATSNLKTGEFRDKSFEVTQPVNPTVVSMEAETSPTVASSPRTQVEHAATTLMDSIQNVTGNSIVETRSYGTAGKSIRISLMPEELGQVEITVSKRGQKIEISIRAEMDSARELLRADARELLDTVGQKIEIGETVSLKFSSFERSDVEEFKQERAAFAFGGNLKDGTANQQSPRWQTVKETPFLHGEAYEEAVAINHGSHVDGAVYI
jgi:flagellar hook-length control protein FliK